MNLKASYILFCLSIMVSNLFAQELSDFQWENRLLVMYADSNERSSINDQQLVFQDTKDQLEERKLILFHFDGSTLTKIYPSVEQFKIEDIGIEFKHPYESVLIGLDGGVKKRWKSVVSPEIIFDLIDSMPMRRAEIRNKQIRKQ